MAIERRLRHLLRRVRRVQRRLDLQRAHALLLRVRAGQGHGARGVGGVVQQRVDLVHEERVEALGDLFLVCEGEGALEGDPVGVEVSCCLVVWFLLFPHYRS
jgi:hypothetical protein